MVHHSTPPWTPPSANPGGSLMSTVLARILPPEYIPGTLQAVAEQIEEVIRARVKVSQEGARLGLNGTALAAYKEATDDLRGVLARFKV